MNRALFFGIAMFFAMVGIALVGADNKASAGFRHRGCGGCNGGCSASADCGGCSASADCGGCSGSACNGCHGRRHCCGLLHRLRSRCCGCHGNSCNGGCSGSACNGGGCNGGGCSGSAPAAEAPAETPPPAPAAT